MLITSRVAIFWNSSNFPDFPTQLGPHSIINTNVSFLTDMFLYTHRKQDSYIIARIITHVLTFCCIFCFFLSTP